MLITRPQPFSIITLSSSSPNPNSTPSHVLLSTIPSLASPLSLRRHRQIFNSPILAGRFRGVTAVFAHSTVVEQSESVAETEDSVDFPDAGDAFDSAEMRRLGSPELEVKELDELPEQWRRSKLAWLCKELPAHKSGTMVRILNAQKKWVRQEDATYLAVHCMRIRENETGFKVYKWMSQQHWYRFDFALATKLADYMGKERKFAKCREIFDDIINQGRVPNESTFHILIVAYLSVPVEGCLEQACGIYNRMIQLGGYQPRLSLHNSLFKSIITKPGSSARHYLKQSEFIFHNLVTNGLNIHKEIYGGLIWLHSYQDEIDRERIAALRKEMREAGFVESKEVLVSVLRACSRDEDLDEAEKTWTKLLRFDGGPSSQAFVYWMEIFGRVGNPRKSLEIFRSMNECLGSANAVSYHKIVEILCKDREVELAESLMAEFVSSGLKPVMPAYIEVMNMYFNLRSHEKVELAFYQCREKCQPSRTVYSIYLDSLVELGNLEKAEEIFSEMQSNTSIGITTRSCNTMLRGYLSIGDDPKAVTIYKMMCEKKHEVDSSLMEKVDIVLSSLKRDAKRPVRPKLSKEQREALVGFLLGGLRIESNERRTTHMVHFDFSERSETRDVLKRHVHDLYREWLHPSCQVDDGNENVPGEFFTVSHHFFGFYADQFWPAERPAIPKLIHRWLSPCSLAYWYMYSGHRTLSGDILLKVKGSQEGVEKVLKSLKARSLNCKVKKKGRTFWIGFLGSNSALFWRIVEPYVLVDLKDSLRPEVGASESGGALENENLEFESGSDTEERASFDYSDTENL